MNIIFQNKRLTIIVCTVMFLMLIPFVAMQFTNEVNWSQSDFVIAGTLLLGTGLLCELVMRKIKMLDHPIALCVILLSALFLVWAELAVGIFGTPFAGQ